jgi:hypothetical protein
MFECITQMFYQYLDIAMYIQGFTPDQSFPNPGSPTNHNPISLLAPEHCHEASY